MKTELTKPKAQVLWLNLGHPQHARHCGWRRWVVMPGRKWIQLVMCATGERIRITRDQFERAPKQSCDIKCTRTIRRLRENAKTFGNNTTAVKQAIAALREVA